MDLQRIDAAIRAYEEQGVSEPMARRLEFFRGLWAVLERHESDAGARLGDGAGLPPVDELDAWYWDGLPLLSRAPASVRREDLMASVRDVTEYIAASGEFDADGVLELTSCDWGELITPSCLDYAGADPASLLEVARVRSGSDMVVMVLSLALRASLEPFQAEVMRALRDRLVEEDRTHAKPLRCPVCGGDATAAYVGPTESSAGNGRRLYCGQCGATWEFERVRCARCGSTDQGTLHYYNVVGDERHRVHACEKCGGTIRTTFATQGGSVLAVPEVEDVVMADLDAVVSSGAIKEACGRPTRAR